MLSENDKKMSDLAPILAADVLDTDIMHVAREDLNNFHIAASEAKTLFGAAAGANTQVQYNNNGAFGASSNFVYASDKINLQGTSPGFAIRGGESSDEHELSTGGLFLGASNALIRSTNSDITLRPSTEIVLEGETQLVSAPQNVLPDFSFGDAKVKAPQGTGTGTPSNVLIQTPQTVTPGTTVQTLVDTIKAGVAGIVFHNEYTFPLTDGTANQILQTDGAGQLVFVDAGAGSIGGSIADNQVAVGSAADTIEGTAALTFDGDVLTVGDTGSGTDNHIHVTSATNRYSQLRLCDSNSAQAFQIDYSNQADRKIGSFSIAAKSIAHMNSGASTGTDSDFALRVRSRADLITLRLESNDAGAQTKPNIGGPTASGVNVAGQEIVIASGQGTGNALASGVTIQSPDPTVSGSTIQSLLSIARFAKSANHADWCYPNDTEHLYIHAGTAEGFGAFLQLESRGGSTPGAWKLGAGSITGDIAPGICTLWGTNASATATGANQDGGSIDIRPGLPSGVGSNGLIKLLNLPTSDPGVANALWNSDDNVVLSGFTGGGGGGTPGGNDTNIQFNNAGAFGGSDLLTWDGTSFTFPQAIAVGTADPHIGGPTASGTDLAGQNVVIAAGIGTGDQSNEVAGESEGQIIFKASLKGSSGVGVNTLEEVMRFGYITSATNRRIAVRANSSVDRPALVVVRDGDTTLNTGIDSHANGELNITANGRCAGFAASNVVFHNNTHIAENSHLRFTSSNATSGTSNQIVLTPTGTDAGLDRQLALSIGGEDLIRFIHGPRMEVLGDITGPTASGTNIAGQNVVIASGIGTGDESTEVVGESERKIIFKSSVPGVSGTGVNSLDEVMHIKYHHVNGARRVRIRANDHKERPALMVQRDGDNAVNTGIDSLADAEINIISNAQTCMGIRNSAVSLHASVNVASTKHLRFTTSGNTVGTTNQIILTPTGTDAGLDRQLALSIAGADVIRFVQGGNIDMPALPTSDPSVAGRLWNNAGVLNVSAG
jgi:hypothetical protein